MTLKDVDINKNNKKQTIMYIGKIPISNIGNLICFVRCFSSLSNRSRAKSAVCNFLFNHIVNGPSIKKLLWECLLLERCQKRVTSDCCYIST